jgi:hypothetical protein
MKDRVIISTREIAMAATTSPESKVTKISHSRAQERLHAPLRTLIYFVSFVLVFTSLIDLFINRLLFRAGPDVLKHITISGSYLAVVGRIAITLEQFLLVVMLLSGAILLLQEDTYFRRLVGAFLISIVVCSAALYLPLADSQAWAVSTLLVSVAMITIIGLACLNISKHSALSWRQRLTLIIFLGCLVLGFILPLYYRMYLLIGAVRPTSLPYPLTAYMGGIFAVMATELMVFVYALLAPSPTFALDYRKFVKAAVLPTVLVVPLLYEMMRSFFVTQILGMVVAMSTDLVLTHDLLQVLVAVWWFFLTGVLLLVVKGHYSTNKLLQQEAVGLVLIMSTTFLFNYPYYLMLGIAGVFLVSYPLIDTATD